MHGNRGKFRPGNMFGRAGPRSHSEFYSAENMSNWRKEMEWKEPKERSRKKKTKKNKKKKKTGRKSKDQVELSELFAKLSKRGKTEVTIEGKKFIAEFVDGELFLTETYN